VTLCTLHIINTGPDERAHRKRLAYRDGVRPLLHPADETFSMGIGLESANDSWLARWIFGRFGGAGEGNGRGWQAIRDWPSTALADQLADERPSVLSDGR
jgi:hypothetical protein